MSRSCPQTPTRYNETSSLCWAKAAEFQFRREIHCHRLVAGFWLMGRLVHSINLHLIQIRIGTENRNEIGNGNCGLSRSDGMIKARLIIIPVVDSLTSQWAGEPIDAAAHSAHRLYNSSSTSRGKGTKGELGASISGPDSWSPNGNS